MNRTSPDITTAKHWIEEADRILIGAGAGLTAAAGYDYTDPERFAELFPAMVALGFHARYELIGQTLPPPLLWGYWYTHVNDIRYSAAPNHTYHALRRLVGQVDHFVMTSNVDALFARNGFDPDRIFTPQGDYGRLQCLTPCTRDTWDTLPWLERGLATFDPATGTIAADTVPACPKCGGPVFLNVNLGRDYINDAFLPAGERLNHWLGAGGPDQRLLILEIGAGYNTPAVIRWPLEQLARTLPNARLIRVNPETPHVPDQIAPRALAVRTDASKFLNSMGT